MPHPGSLSLEPLIATRKMCECLVERPARAVYDQAQLAHELAKLRGRRFGISHEEIEQPFSVRLAQFECPSSDLPALVPSARSFVDLRSIQLFTVGLRASTGDSASFAAFR